MQSAALRMCVLYASSFASLLAGAHLVHITVRPDMVKYSRVLLIVFFSLMNVHRIIALSNLHYL